MGYMGMTCRSLVELEARYFRFYNLEGAYQSSVYAASQSGLQAKTSQVNTEGLELSNKVLSDKKEA